MNVSTSCVHGYCPSTSLNSQPKQHLHYKSTTTQFDDKIPWLSTSKTTPLVLQSRRRTDSVRKNAVPDPESLLVAGPVTSPAKSGDITVFLITSAGFLFLFWVTNFLVPDILSKDLGFDKDQKKK